MNTIDRYMFETKVGYDWANKKMLIRVYDHLKYAVENYTRPTWLSVVKDMLGPNTKLNPNGYYSAIRQILKDIEVIQMNNGKMSKGSNWDRFYSDEDWSWFVTNTNSGGHGQIIK